MFLHTDHSGSHEPPYLPALLSTHVEFIHHYHWILYSWMTRFPLYFCQEFSIQ